MTKPLAPCGILLILLAVSSHSASAAPLSASALARNCTIQVNAYTMRRQKAGSTSNDVIVSDSSLFDTPYEIHIGGRRVPVYPFRQGVSNATLIALVHNKNNSATEQPIVDGICPDNTGHEFSYDESTKTLNFASQQNELLTLLFRLDAQTLPNTTWHTSASDSVYMVDTSVPPPANLPKPNKGDWCSGRNNDAQVNGHELWFTMCPHHGMPREFVYTLAVLVNGKEVLVDPQIINRPH
jgi:hypothetical protein